jgi:hypothetical protein
MTRLKTALVLLAVVLASACGTRTADIAVAMDMSAHTQLAQVDNLLDARCDSGTLTPTFCRDANGVLAETWAIKNRINRQLRNGVDLANLSADVAGFRASIQRLIVLVQALDPRQQDGLLPDLHTMATATLAWDR